MTDIQKTIQVLSVNNYGLSEDNPSLGMAMQVNHFDDWIFSTAYC